MWPTTCPGWTTLYNQLDLVPTLLEECAKHTWSPDDTLKVQEFVKLALWWYDIYKVSSPAMESYRYLAN
jgi:hypothetical protein